MQIIFDAEKARQTEIKHDNEIVPAHNAEVKAYNRRLAGRMFLLGAPFLSVVFFGIYLMFYMAITGNWTLPHLVSKLYVLACIFVITEMCTFALFQILKDDDWWIRYDPNNYPAAVKYLMHTKNKTILESAYKYGEIYLVLEDPATHIVTTTYINVRDFEKTRRSDISDIVIDLHEETIYTPYAKDKESSNQAG